MGLFIHSSRRVGFWTEVQADCLLHKIMRRLGYKRAS